MVKDSNVCDWLIVVKSGAVSVLKKLVKVKSTVSKRTGQYKRTTSTSRYLSFISHAKDYARWLHNHSFSLPPPLSVTDEEDGCDVSEDNKSDQLCVETVGRDYKKDVENAEFNNCDDMAIQAVTRAMRPHTGHVGNQTDIRTRLRNAWSAKDGGSRATRIAKTGNFKTVKIKFDLESAAVSTNDQRTFADNRSCTDNLASCPTAREVRVLTAAGEVSPQFVLVHTLTKGDVFGLSSLVFLDQPSLCLVSNGAECLLIKKRFYLDNCPPDLMRRLKVEVSPYPSEKKLQQDLVDRVNWDIYKSVVRQQVTGHKQLKVAMLRSPATVPKC